MRIGSLCSGVDGLGLGLEWAGVGEPAWFCESERACWPVLERAWPGRPIYPDVWHLPFEDLEPVDLLTAGFPCQPVSLAGRRRAQRDERWLWPAVADAVRVLRPRLVLVENVPGLLIPWQDDDGGWNPAPVEEVLGDLAEMGFDARWVCVRAAEVGAPHGRARVFLLAEDARRVAPGTELQRDEGLRAEGDGPPGRSRRSTRRAAPDSGGSGLEGPGPADKTRRLLPARDAGSPAPNAQVRALGRGLREGRTGGVGRGRSADGGLEALTDPQRGQLQRGGGPGLLGAAAPAGASKGPERQRVRAHAGDRHSEAPPDSDRRGQREGSRIAVAQGERQPWVGAPPDADIERRAGIGAPPGGAIAGESSWDDALRLAAEYLGEGITFPWEVYLAAVLRWSVLFRPVPRPLDGRRLRPEFVEWMMGFPEGWTAGMKRRAALTALGNAVVPHVAALVGEQLLLGREASA